MAAPGLGVYAEVFGDKHCMATMEAWAARGSNLLPAFGAIHEYLLAVEEELFETEGESGQHGSWAPRKKNADGHPLLDDTGELKKSLTDAAHPDHSFLPTRRGFSFGTRNPVAQAHQTGTEFMEQRRVVDLTAGQRETMLGIISSYIVSAGLEPVGGMGGLFQRVRGGRGRFIG